jgi:hypothetical protein
MVKVLGLDLGLGLRFRFKSVGLRGDGLGFRV